MSTTRGCVMRSGIRQARPSVYRDKARHGGYTAANPVSQGAGEHPPRPDHANRGEPRMMSLRKLCAALVAACLGLPAVTAAADLIPVESFARHASMSMPRLSPDGHHIAVRMDDGGNHALVIYDVADMSKPVSMLRMPKFEMPVDVQWVSPTRLVVEKGKMLGSIDRPV